MRIGFTTNAPWSPTGYGVQASELVPKLVADGHNVALMANYGLAGTTLNWNGVTVFGQGMDAYSNDLTPAQIAFWLSQQPSEPGIGLSLYDVWVYKSPQWDEIPMASWTPVDHKGVPDEVKSWFDRRGKGKWAIAMSQFGERELLEAGVDRDRLFYAPHSFNPQIFKPTPSAMRKDLNVPDEAHLTIINSANKGVTPIRKCWPEMLLAWSNFAKSHPDAYLLIWTEAFGLANGVNIDRVLKAVDAPMDRVRFVPQFEYRQGLNQEVVANAYSASDVLLMTSRGEGFGVPAIEAQACGIPVILTDWTAQTELVGSGWLVDGQKEWDPLQGGWWKVPNVKKIEDALVQSYELKSNKENKDKEKEKAIDFAANYATEKVYSKYWRPILKQLELEVSPKEKK
jgi:glycosyltransferase involved in cell wall biosynthesis